MELLQSMRLFARLAELQSFTKVAEALQMGHPQVTLAINQLEASLGVRLFQRTTRKVNLTAEGEAFLVRVAGIPGEVDEAVTMFGAPGDIVRGPSPDRYSFRPGGGILHGFIESYGVMEFTAGRVTDLIW